MHAQPTKAEILNELEQEILLLKEIIKTKKIMETLLRNNEAGFQSINNEIDGLNLAISKYEKNYFNNESN